MADIDYSGADPTSINPLTGLPIRSVPIPGLPQGAIPGIRGVVSPGLWPGSDGKLDLSETWDPNDPNSAWDPATGKRVQNPAIGSSPALEQLSASGSVAAPSVRKTKPEVQDRLVDILADTTRPVQTTREPTQVMGGRPLNGEARSGDSPGAPIAQAPEETAAMPPTIPPREGTLTPSSGFHLFPEGSLLDRLMTNIGNFRDQNRLTLLAMGGGLAGSQSWGQGLGRAFTAAVPAARADYQIQNQNVTATALMNNFGIRDPNLARAIATNPQMMQELLPFLTGTNKQWQLGETTDIFNRKRPFLYSPITGETKMLNVGGAAAAGAGGGGNLPGNVSPEQWDQMSSDQRFAAYQAAEPELAGALKAYHEGRDVPPTRMPAVKMIAPSIWPDYNENLYTENRTLATGLMKDSPNSTGGLIKNGLSTFGHTADAAEAAADVGDVLGANTMAPNWVGRGVNLGYNAMVAGQTQHGKLEAQSRAFGTAGQEATKFYTAAGGSAPERMEGKEVANQSATAGERAGWLRETSKLLLDRVQIVMGPVINNPAVGAPWVQRNIGSFQKAQSDLARMDRALAQLDPAGPEAQAISAGRPTPNMQRFAEILGPLQPQQAPAQAAAPGPQAAQQPVQQVQPAPPQQQRQVNHVYQTPRGPMRWMADGWHPVQ